jgi:hypothetical protein
LKVILISMHCRDAEDTEITSLRLVGLNISEPSHPKVEHSRQGDGTPCVLNTGHAKRNPPQITNAILTYGGYCYNHV